MRTRKIHWFCTRKLDENLSRTETYLYVFALNDADLLSLRAAEPQTTSWYVTLNRIKKALKAQRRTTRLMAFSAIRKPPMPWFFNDQTSNPTPFLWNYIRESKQEDPSSCSEPQGNQWEYRPCPYSEPERISARCLHLHGYTPWHSGRYKRRTASCIFPTVLFCAPRQAMSVWRLPA